MRRFLVLIVSALVIELIFPTRVRASLPVQITEFLPDPEGSDAEGEWIELYNASSESADLTGYTLQDLYGTSKTVLLSELPDAYRSIQPSGYLLLPFRLTGITLNNDREQLRLSNDTGGFAETGVGEEIQEGHAFGWTGERWEETIPTPGSANTPVSAPSPTPLPTPAATPSPTPSPSPFPSPTPLTNLILTGVALSEIFPCTGKEEWIEVKNDQSERVSLTGWVVRDESGQERPLDQLTVPAFGFGVIAWQGYLLNNTGDRIDLINPLGEQVDTFAYDGCESGRSWSNVGGNWVLQAPTRMKENTREEMRTLVASASAASDVNLMATGTVNESAAAPIDQFPADSTEVRRESKIVPLHMKLRADDLSSNSAYHQKRDRPTPSNLDQSNAFEEVYFLIPSGISFLFSSGILLLEWYNRGDATLAPIG